MNKTKTNSTEWKIILIIVLIVFLIIYSIYSSVLKTLKSDRDSNKTGYVDIVKTNQDYFDYAFGTFTYEVKANEYADYLFGGTYNVYEYTIKYQNSGGVDDELIFEDNYENLSSDIQVAIRNKINEEYQDKLVNQYISPLGLKLTDLYVKDEDNDFNLIENNIKINDLNFTNLKEHNLKTYGVFEIDNTEVLDILNLDELKEKLVRDLKDFFDTIPNSNIEITIKSNDNTYCYLTRNYLNEYELTLK